MTNRATECANVGELTSGRIRWTGYAVLGAVCALVIGVYDWSAKSGWLELTGVQAANSYYNLLVQGFQAGQLNLKREVPPGLAQLADAHDPLAKDSNWRTLAGRPIHDLSYYQGKFYLYFGITPALVLFWPWYELSGHYLFHRDAVLIFCAVGFMAGLGLLAGLWRRYFAEVSVGVVVACILALGLVTGTPLLLVQSDVYEVAVSCGYALTMLALVLIWRALHDKRWRSWWLAVASLAYGLAVGARPSLLLGAVILLVPVVLVWRETAEPGRLWRVWPLLLAAVGPIMLVGLGLMLYNMLRFGDPLEFGQRYQLSAFPQDTMDQFSLRYLWINFRIGLLEPARWSVAFPFVRDITLPPLPRGYFEAGHAFGALTNMPLVWLGLLAPLAWRGRLAEGRPILHSLLAAVALLFGTSALPLCLHNSMNLRYEVEFMSPLVLLAVLGIFGLERALAGRLVWRRVTRWGWGLLLVFSVTFNLLARYEFFSETYHNLGDHALHWGTADEAIVHYQKALTMKPGYAEAHTGLGMALFQAGRVAEATSHFAEALRLRPGLEGGHYNLGKALFRQGRLTGATEQYERALSLKPDDAEAHNDLAVALFQQGQVPEAIGHLEEALRLQPDHAEAHNNLGKALFQLGKMPEAMGHLEEVLRVNPDDAEARNNLGTALFGLGKVPEAVQQYEQALRLKPTLAKARNNLGIALAQLGEGLAAQGKWAEAIRHYERAIQMKPDNVQAHDALGMALSRVGRFADAVRAAKTALELAKVAGQADAAKQIQERLLLYQADRQYHEGSTPAP